MHRLERSWQVMGVLNVTPDSFYDGGNYFVSTMELKPALHRAEQMLAEGAAILDVGGESTRPGAKAVSLDEEAQRVLPLIEQLRRQFPKSQISVDTRKPQIAKQALALGANIINDVSGLADAGMIDLLKSHADVQAVLMHMRGDPQTMQLNPTYDDVVSDVLAFFQQRLETLKQHGIAASRLILDPGIGFGKTVQHNLELIRHAARFTTLGSALMIGASRKSFIGKVLDLPQATERLEGSLAVAVAAFERGATIFRVHDVKATVQALKMAQAIAEA